jgi:hypothetical protein
MRFDYGDPERLLIIILIVISIYLIIKEPRYARVVKTIKIVPRLYLFTYYTLVLVDAFRYTDFQQLILTGIGNIYGILLLFIAEVYLQWANRKYGRK